MRASLPNMNPLVSSKDSIVSEVVKIRERSISIDHLSCSKDYDIEHRLSSNLVFPFKSSGRSGDDSLLKVSNACSILDDSKRSMSSKRSVALPVLIESVRNEIEEEKKEENLSRSSLLQGPSSFLVP